MPDKKYLQPPDIKTSYWAIYLRLPKKLWEDGKTKYFRESTGKAVLSDARKIRDRRLPEIREEWDRQIAAKEGRTFYTYADLKRMGFHASARMEYLVAPPLGGPQPIPLKELYAELEIVDDKVRRNVDRLVREGGLTLDAEQRLTVERFAKNHMVAEIEQDISITNGDRAFRDVVVMEEKRVRPETIPDEAWNRGVTGKITLDQAIIQYQKSKPWKKLAFSTQTKYIRSFKLLKRCLTPTRDVGTLLPLDFDRVEEIFSGLPVRVSDKGKLDKIVKKTERENRIADETVNSHYNAIRGLFDWLKTNCYIQSNIAADKLISPLEDEEEKEDKKPKIIGVPFDESDLKKIFNRPKDTVFWGAAISLFSGCRLEEAMQLRPRDFVQRDGVWCISHNRIDGNTLKTNSSVRLVPVHSALIKAGLLDVLADNQDNKNGRIFGELVWTKNGKWARRFVKKFDRWTVELGIKPPTPKRKSFHSFRYLMTDVLLAKTKKTEHGLVDAILGWSTEERRKLKKTMRIHYSGRAEKEVPVKDLKRIIEQVQYPWFG